MLHVESGFGLYFQHYLSCLLLVEERSTAYKGNGGRFRTWLQRSVISSPLFTFVDFLLWQVDHQEPVSHPQPSGSTLSSYRWCVIHVAEVLTDAHSMTYAAYVLQPWCTWYQRYWMTKFVIDFSVSPSVLHQYHGEEQGIWRHGHLFLSQSGKKSI